MKYRNLGATGLQVSKIAFGSYLTFGYAVDLQIAKRLMKTAYEAGINLFDNAEIYALGQSEEIMGQALKELKWPRDTYILMTKVFWGGPKPTQTGLHRKHIYECCSTSLKRLNVDYIDLFLCHRPDPNTPIEETVRAMHQLVMQGKILYWGTSEWSREQIQEAIFIAENCNITAPSLEQFQYNMLEREKTEKELIPLFLQKKLGATITLPLAGGVLTGKYNNTIPKDSRYSRFSNSLEPYLVAEKWEPVINKIKNLTIIAESLGMSMAQLAIAWCLKNQNISSIIVGTSNEDQLKENISSIGFVNNLTLEIMDDIEKILDNKPKVIDYCLDYDRAKELS